MSASASLRAQAKVNLALRVLARESSGYHQIETLFCRLELADLVRVELTRDGSRSLVCEGPALPLGGLGPPEENLAWTAASRCLQVAGDPRGFRIEITKSIPTGGGLGGGSADAGAVIRLLLNLLQSPDLTARVDEVAGSLGADVPFLAQARSTLALAWGRGDRMMLLPALPRRECLLIVAPFGVQTAAAYGWLTAEGWSGGGPRLSDLAGCAAWARIAETSANDFEGPVFHRHPALARAAARVREALGDRALVRMSGSGSTLFAIAARDDTALPDIGGLSDGFHVVRTWTAVTTDSVT